MNNKMYKYLTKHNIYAEHGSLGHIERELCTRTKDLCDNSWLVHTYADGD